jgi:ubiquinone/menaquinone biosynthesis C-methylase UbiE
MGNNTTVASLLDAGPRVMESSPVHHSDEAREYERMVDRHVRLLNRPFVDLLAGLRLRRGKVLDVGTGPGLIPVELAARKPGWDIWALDSSEDMLARGEHRALRAGVADRVHFIPGQADRLPFEDGEFDVVCSHFMLHHLERPEAFLDETARVVRGGGRVIIKDLLRPPRWKAHLLLTFSRVFLGYSELQLQMYRESIDAALTVSEVRSALAASRLSMANLRRFRGLDFIIEA